MAGILMLSLFEFYENDVVWKAIFVDVLKNIKFPKRFRLLLRLRSIDDF